MAERSEQQRILAIRTDDLKPFVSYRNPEDDKIQLAIQEAERRLREQGEAVGEGLANLRQTQDKVSSRGIGGRRRTGEQDLWRRRS